MTGASMSGARSLLSSILLSCFIASVFAAFPSLAFASQDDILFNLVDYNLKNGDLFNARKLLDEILETDPNNGRARQYLRRLDVLPAGPSQTGTGEVSVRRPADDRRRLLPGGRTGEAVVDSARMLELSAGSILGPDSVRVDTKEVTLVKIKGRLRFARELSAEGKAEEAYLKLKEALSLDPDNFETLFELGRMHISRSDFHEAVNVFTRLTKTEPQNKAREIYFYLGLCLYNSGYAERAKLSLQKSIELDAGYPPPYLELANILRNQKQAAEAVRLLNAYSEKFGSDLNSDLMLADSWFSLANYENSSRVYASLIGRFPREAAPLTGLARILLLSRQTGEALKLVNSALKLDPRNAQAHDQRGVALWMLGNSKEALSEFNSAIRLKPGLETAHQNKVNLLLKANDENEAHKAAENAARLNPGSAELNYIAGKLSHRLKLYRNSQKYMLKAYALDSGYRPLEILNYIAEASSTLSDPENLKFAADEGLKAAQALNDEAAMKRFGKFLDHTEKTPISNEHN